MLSEDGAGVSGTFLVIGFSVEWRTGRVLVRVVKDTYTLGDVTTLKHTDFGALKPLIAQVFGLATQPTTNTFVVPVDPVGAPGQDIGIILDTFATEELIGSFVRVVRPAQLSAGISLLQERPGWIEAYATVTALSFDSGTNRNYVTLSFHNAWNRGVSQYLAQQLLTPGECHICVTDERQAASNLQNVDIQPNAAQLYNGGTGRNFIKTAGPKPFDRIKTLIRQV